MYNNSRDLKKTYFDNNVNYLKTIQIYSSS